MGSRSHWLILCAILCLSEILHAQLSSHDEPENLSQYHSIEELHREHPSECKKYKKHEYREKRQAANVGLPCNENIDCLTVNFGSYCDPTKRCDCLSTYVNLGGFCWRKYNPGETGCQNHEQCNSVWPGATCSSANKCICPNNQPEYPTSDGAVCISAGGCPTNAFNSKLKDEVGVDAQCTIAAGCFPALDYDCYCNPALTPTDIDCLGQSYCCPSRAIACIMPKEEGIFSGSTQRRFYYNAATDTCEDLNYQGQGGNANNFNSRAQCESYCKTGCPRGRPLYDAATSAFTAATRTTCSTATACPTSASGVYTCNSDTSNASPTPYCCLRADTICSASGGIVSIPAPPTSPNVGIQGPPSIIRRQRWWYDPVTRRCAVFTYLGQGGNYNNFETEDHCLRYCSQSVCEQGDPLRDANRNTVACSSSVPCPSRYECRLGTGTGTATCCPTKDFICNLQQAIGSCMTYSQKWWFNPDTRTCVQFTYSGCQGNFNNFATYQACQNYCGSSNAAPKCPQGQAEVDPGTLTYYVCSPSSTTSTVCPLDTYCYYDGIRYGCCPTKVKTCSNDAGAFNAGTACVTPVSRWWYNSANRKCEQFTYGGCDGNSNNFATQLDCQDYCGVGGCKEGGGEPFKETSGQYRICTASGSECPTGFSCAQVVTAASTVAQLCCASKDYVCRLPQEQGISCGTSNLNRYFFNPVTRVCEMFTFRGCAGNRNNFASLKQCQDYCNSASCAPGQVAITEPSSTRLVTCQTSGSGTGCGGSNTCVVSSLLGQNICCGNNAPVGTCPPGESAYMDAFSNFPLQCIQNTDGQCPLTPNRYDCRPSTVQSGTSFCCASVIVQCSRGGSVGLDASNNPRQCTPLIPSNCPSGYECQPTGILVVTLPSATGYCCGTANPCGSGFNTLFTNNNPVTCDANLAINPCSNPTYTCTRTASGQGYCCIPAGLAVNPCGTGRNPYRIQNAPTVCIPGSGNTGAGCPVGYTCDIYSVINTYYCCTGSVPPPPAGQGACPAGSPLVTTCSINSNCGVGYVCKPGTSTPTCCPAPAAACVLPQEVGQTCTTASPSQRYLFNPSTRSCIPFSYLGCNANNNNFFSAQACEEFCMPGLCGRGRPQYLSGGSAQTCTTSAQCNSGYECRPAQFGSGGSICCQLSTSVCAMPMDPGRSCSTISVTAMQLWYFNSATRACLQFSFSGCGGNPNSFETQSECASFCGGQIIPLNPCPSPRTAQINPATNQPMLCVGIVTGCGAGFQCTYSPTALSYYCCSRATTGGSNGCPFGSPYLYPRTNSPLACTLGGPNRCPNNYVCAQSTTFAGSQCCSSTVVQQTFQAATMPVLRCTSNDYCKDRLKSVRATCNMSSLSCSCGSSETFTTKNACETSPTG